MIDDPLSLLSLGVWLMAAGMWPVAFLFGACSPCCQPGDPCPWLLEFDRCLRVSLVGSDPPEGGDCLILSGRAGSGDVEYMTGSILQIHNVQSRISITVRLSLSASGTSRTPVGETRTQVWRFNRATPTFPAQSVYDVLGPAWHLQVDLSVTGVATQEEAGVVSALETDEHGQPKLVLAVNQWTATITHDESVILFPVGLQRWGPGLGNTQSFRLTSSSVTATLVSGTSYSGWSVSKLTGLTIQDRALAMRLAGTLCPAGSGRSLGAAITERIALDEGTTIDFLNGDTDFRVNVPTGSFAVSAGDRDLRITPKNALCGLPQSNLAAGIALGIYPEQVYAEPPPEYADAALSIRGVPYCNTGLITLRHFVRTNQFWRPSWNFRGISFYSPGASPPGLFAEPSFFYGGWSLLWNLEIGSYRTSAIDDGPGPFFPGTSSFNIIPGWTYYLEGESDPYFDRLMIGPCPEGMELPIGNIFSVCTNTPFAISGSFSGTYRPFSNADPRNVSGDLSGNVVRFSDFVIGTTNNAGELEDGIILIVEMRGDEIADVNESGSPVTITPEFFTTYRALPPCEVSGDLSLVVVSQGGFFIGAITDAFDATFDVPTVSFDAPPRPACGEWTPSPFDGGQITRSCDATLGPPLAEETVSVPARLNNDVAASFPIRLGVGTGSPAPTAGNVGEFFYFGPAPTQLGKCNLLGVRLTTNIQVSKLPVAATHIQSPTFGSCISYIPAFGLALVDGASRTDSIPCNDCTVSVVQTAGEENGTVTLITSGDKAGVIEIVVARTWLGGQGVTFTVSCGDDTITQVVRRADTRPEPITGLSVVRDPCSTATLTWEAPHDGGQPITEYRVEFRRIGASNWTLHSTTLSLTATITGLVRVGYEFRVFSVNSVNVSLSSNVVTNGFALGAPTSLTFTRDPCDEVQLSWVAPTQSECVVVANYRLEYREGISGTFLVFGTVAGTQTTGTVTGLDPTLRYQFRVARIADDGPDLFSNTVTSGSVPATPTGVVAALGTEPGEVDLTWSAVEQLCFPNTDYLVQFRPSTTSTWSDFTRAASTDKFATVTGLTPATYFFRVRATNSIGNGGFSAQSNSVTIPEPE